MSRKPLGARSSNVPSLSLGLTPNKRTSFGSSFGDRTSFAGKHRRSSIRPSDNSKRLSNQGTRTQIKDPRNLTNRVFQKKIIEDIVCFLQQSSYVHPINVRSLMTPTSKEFLRVFEFLVSFILPGYPMGKKFEEEVPKVLKYLRYPFVISKSSLYSIGSLHSWPNLLGALHWMVELISYGDKAHEETFDNEVEQDENQIILSYIKMSYCAFMNGKDDLSEWDDYLEKMLTPKDSADIDKLREDNERLEKDYEAINCEKDELAEYQQMVKEAENELNHLETEDANIDREIALMQKDAELMKDELIQLGVDPREITGDDVSKSKWETRYNQIITQKKIAEEEWLASNEKCQQKEMEISILYDKVSKAITEYNEVAAFVMANSDSTLLQTNNITMSLDHHQSSMNKPSRNQEHIMPVLNQLSAETSEKIGELEHDGMQTLNTLDQIHELYIELQSEKNGLEKKLSQLEKENESNTNEWEDQLKAVDRVNTVHDSKCNEKLEEMKQRLEEVNQHHKETIDEITSAKNARDDERDQVVAYLNEFFQSILDHKESIDGYFAEAEEKARQGVEDTQRKIAEMKLNR